MRSGSIIGTILEWMESLDSLNNEGLKGALKNLPEDKGIAKKQFMVALRHALGEKVSDSMVVFHRLKIEWQTGPPIADIILLVGREETIKRLNAALKAIHIEEV
jgi:hypothetical protein